MIRPTNVAALALIAMAQAGCGIGTSKPVVSAGITGDQPLSLDERYLIGPTAARELGLRIDFQTHTFPEGDSGLDNVEIEGDSIFVLDGENFLTRLRRSDGRRLWRLPVADPYLEIYGINYMPQTGLIYLTVGGDVLVLDRNTGSQVDRQPLTQMASTAPVPFGSFLIYGSRNGQIVWHSYEVGHQWRGYEISSTVRIAPLLVDGYLVAIGADGRVIVLDPRAAARIWDKQLLNEVVAPPVAGNGMVYFAGLDQYVWGLELSTGRNVWRYLTEAPLTDSPVLIGDRLYQQIPTEGLVCFDALPVDAPGGVKMWTAAGVRGSVLSERNSRLLVWDREHRRLTVVESDRGDVVTTINLPAVQHLFAPTPTSGDLYAAGDDGRVIRLVPR